MTYEELGSLMINDVFRIRLKVAVLKFSDYLINGRTLPGTTNALWTWAQQAYRAPDQAVEEVRSPVVLNPAIRDAQMVYPPPPQDGEAQQPPYLDVSDDQIQGAVEATVRNLLS